MKSKSRYAFGFAALLIGGAAVVGFGGTAAVVGPERLSNSGYQTSTTTRGSVRKTVATSGSVRARVTVSVGSQLSGQIRELKVDFNSEVRAGEELAVLDDTMFVAKVAQAKADVAAGKAALRHQEAAFVKAEAIAQNALRLLNRQQTLADKGSVAATVLENAHRDTQVAQAELDIVRAQIEHARAAIEQREAQLVQAQIEFERTRIRSPINGTVISRTVDVGQTVAASLQAPELFKIAQDLTHITIEAQVSEADIGGIAAGNLVEFSVDAFPNQQFRGSISQLRLGANELNNIVTFTVIIEAANPDRRLLPGMTANVHIETAVASDVPRIPIDAFRYRPRHLPTPNAQELSALRLKGAADRLVSGLALTTEQIERINGAVYDARGRAQSGTRVITDVEGQLRHLKEVAATVITQAQRGAFERWVRDLEAVVQRRFQRSATVWVLNRAGAIEPRYVRVGLADESFAEVLEGLEEGDRVVTRTREKSQR